MTVGKNAGQSRLRLFTTAGADLGVEDQAGEGGNLAHLFEPNIYQ